MLRQTDEAAHQHAQPRAIDVIDQVEIEHDLKAALIYEAIHGFPKHLVMIVDKTSLEFEDRHVAGAALDDLDGWRHIA